MLISAGAVSLCAVRRGGASQTALEQLLALSPSNFWTAEDTTATFQSATGGAPADDATESALFWGDAAQFGGLSFADYAAAQAERVTNGTFVSDLTGWAGALNAPTATFDAGRMKIVGSSGSSGRYQDITGLDAAKTNLVIGTISTDAASAQTCALSLRQGGGFSSISGVSDITAAAGASATETRLVTGVTGIRAFCVAGYLASGGIAYYDDISVKEIPGNPATQTTGSQAAKRQVQDGFAVLDGDGADDSYITTATPALAGAYFFEAYIEAGAAGDVAIGSQPASDGKCYAGIASDGAFAGGLGAEGTTVIKGTTDIRGGWAACSLIWNGDGEPWTAIVNGAVEGTGTQSGAVNTTVAMRLLGLNNNGTPAANAAMMVRHLAYFDTPPDVAAMQAVTAAFAAEH